MIAQINFFLLSAGLLFLTASPAFAVCPPDPVAGAGVGPLIKEIRLDRRFAETPVEAALSVTARVKGASWAREGAEAAVLTVFVDGRYNQDLVLFAGETRFEYRALLGRLGPEARRVALYLNTKRSAAAARAVEIAAAAVARFENETLAAGGRDDAALDRIAAEHAPVIYLRPDTVGKFSDLPLVAYYEILPGERAGARKIRYTTIFSNEDGGTFSQALMARWGRLTDIEWTYEIEVADDGRIAREIYQGANHETKAFDGGRRWGRHPALYDATVNNNFAVRGLCSPLRVILPPVKADLRAASRETVMDRFSWTYRVMTEEARREGRVDPRNLGVNRVADPRDYLYVEVETALENAAIALEIAGGERVSSDEGDARLRMGRRGFNRIAVRRPAGLRRGSLPPALAVRCYALKSDAPGSCLKVAVRKIVTLDENLNLRETIVEGAGRSLAADGRAASFAVGRR